MNIVNGSQVKKLRQLRGWEQQDLADRAGIARSVISRLERDMQVDFQLSVVVSVATALDVGIEDLLQPQHRKQLPELVPELKSVVQQFSSQPEGLQRIAAKILAALLQGTKDEEL